MPRIPSPTRHYKLGAILLILLLGGVLLWPRLQDLPRWFAVRWLAGQLDAEVALDELHIETKQRFRLRGLSVTRPAVLPEVEYVFVAEMEVETTLKQLLAGHLDVLRLRGLVSRLRPAPPALQEAPAETPTLAALYLESAQVTVTSRDGGEQSQFTLQAEATDVSSNPLLAHGHVAITAEELSLRPLAELTGMALPTNLVATSRGFTASLRRTADGERFDLRVMSLHASRNAETLKGEDLVADLHHQDGTLRGYLTARGLQGSLAGFPFDIPSPTLALTGRPREDEDGLLQLVLQPEIPGLGQARLAAEVHPSERSWRELEFTVSETRWGALWPALGLEATSALHLVDDGQDLRIDLEVQSPRLLYPERDLELEDVVLTLAGITPHPHDLRELPTSLEIPSLALTLGSGHVGDHALPRLLQAQGSLRASPEWPGVEAEFRFSEVELFARKPHRLKLSNLRLELTSSQITDLSRLRLSDLQAAGQFGLPPRFPAVPFTLRAAGRPLPQTGFQLESALLELPGLATLQGAGSLRPTADGGRAQLAFTAVDLARWQALLGHEDLGFAIAGDGAAELTASFDLNGRWRLAGPAHLRNAGFTSTDGSRVMEGLSSDLDLVVEGIGPAPRSASATGEAGNFVLLWGTVFGDFLDLSSQIEVTAEASADLANWRLDTRLHLPRIFDLQAGLERPLTATEDELHYDLVLAAEDLQATSQELLARFDGMGELDVGGHLAFRAAGLARDPEHFTATGGLTLTGLRWAGNQATVDGLDLHLPLALERRGAAFSGQRQLGHLRFRRLALRGLQVPPIASALWVEADSLGLLEPLEVPVFGGRIVLEGLGASHLLRTDRHAESGLHLEALDLARIAADLGLFPLEGTIEGDFPRLVLRDDDLEIDGGGQVALFGGTVAIRDIRGADLFTPFPEVTLSADLKDLDLGRLTRRVDFGEMTGILDGNIEGCRLFRGVPVTCQATFRSVTRRGVSRTVDIKAVNNLTILGTGQSTSVLDRGVQRFLKRFTYAALGVDVHLADDVLLLRGLERRGERELFLRGRLPFPIDIVNAQPGGAVSFQAMLRRLKSLDFSQAETSPPQ